MGTRAGASVRWAMPRHVALTFVLVGLAAVGVSSVARAAPTPAPSVSPLSASPRGAPVGVPAPPTVPDWSKDELKTLYTRTEAAGRLETTEAQDAEMARTMGSAYRVLPSAGETADGYARRVLKKIEPVHPEVQAGQWTLALARRFYLDTGKRAETLSRLEPSRQDRQLLEVRSRQSKAAVEAIAALLVTKLDTGGLVAPMPSAPGDKASSFGCEAHVRGEKLEVNRLDRMTFAGHAPPVDVVRTGKGAIRELVSVMKEYNVRAQTMGIIDPAMKAGNKKLRVFLPGAHPARYLNELVRAAEEGGMTQVFVMVLDPTDGKMRELPLLTSEPKAPPRRPKKKGAKAPAAPVTLRCDDDASMQACASKLATARAEGAPLVYVPL
jgi:hypothetical protein